MLLPIITLPCDVCSKIFDTRNSNNTHYTQIEVKEKRMKNKNSVSRHMKVTYAIAICFYFICGFLRNFEIYLSTTLLLFHYRYWTEIRNNTKEFQLFLSSYLMIRRERNKMIPSEFIRFNCIHWNENLHWQDLWIKIKWKN